MTKNENTITEFGNNAKINNSHYSYPLGHEI